MNFSDFGIKDESELEQDEFSLGRPTFGKENQLTVIGWKGKSIYKEKLYILRCSRCREDIELYGVGLFTGCMSSLRKGSASCGCSKSYTRTKTQYEILIKRVCEERGYIFHGFVRRFYNSQNKIKLECPRHGVWETTTVSSFLGAKTGCPKCAVSFNVKEDSFHIDSFMSTGKFKEGTKFWRSPRDCRGAVPVYWSYTCPVCSNDEYVKAGLCSGVFEEQSSSLLSGLVACRCSNSFKWTQDQYEYRIKKKMQESNTTDEFIGFCGNFKNQNSKIIRKCMIHGEYHTSLSSLLYRNGGCPECSNQNQQEAYINFIKDKDYIVALKFGIAKDSKQRLKNQNSQAIFDVAQYGVWKFPDVKSCKAAERYVKKHLPCKLLTKSEMPDGYTETTSIENLEAIIKIYEDFGGNCKISKK